VGRIVAALFGWAGLWRAQPHEREWRCTSGARKPARAAVTVVGPAGSAATQGKKATAPTKASVASIHPLQRCTIHPIGDPGTKSF
jgi:hypothetical protein